MIGRGRYRQLWRCLIPAPSFAAMLDVLRRTIFLNCVTAKLPAASRFVRSSRHGLAPGRVTVFKAGLSQLVFNFSKNRGAFL